MNSTHTQPPQDPLAIAQAELAQCREDIARLQQALEDRTEDLQKLIQWMQCLQQDITAVYQSITWQTGNLMTRMALKILCRPVGPTARDHIEKILASFESWKINYVHSRRVQGVQKYAPWHDTREYRLWIKEYDTLTSVRQQDLQGDLDDWLYFPTFSLFMSVPVAPPKWLREAIESVQKQIYPHWELFLIGPNPDSTSPLGEEVPVAGGDHDPRSATSKIHWLLTSPNDSLATSLNLALETAKGDFIALIDAQDRLSSQALYQIAKTCNVRSDCQLIYTDEDKLDAQGGRCDPNFKSDWNPDLFYSQNYLHRLTVYRRTVVMQVGGFQADYPGGEEYDLTLRVIERIKANEIYHIPKVLYHQRESSLNPTAATVACQVLQAHFQRVQQSVQVREAMGGHTRVLYPLPDPPPLVSLIIPTRDKLDLLRGTVEGVLTQTDYQPLEIIILDNGSVEPATLSYLKQLETDPRVTVLRLKMPFNYSQLNNIGVSHAAGEVIGLLNNDLEVIHSDWLTEMVSHALRPEIGAVGAKLYYANDTIQHAGVIVGLGGMAGHGFKYLAREAPGYHFRPCLIQNYSAVTAACLVMRRRVFQEVGGLEEKHLKVAFNDVDLCLRLRERGYRIVWTPYAELYHLESASRGVDNTVKKYFRLRHELNYMRKRWGKVLAGDPYYSPNLTMEYEDFSLAWWF